MLVMGRINKDMDLPILLSLIWDSQDVSIKTLLKGFTIHHEATWPSRNHAKCAENLFLLQTFISLSDGLDEQDDGNADLEDECGARKEVSIPPSPQIQERGDFSLHAPSAHEHSSVCVSVVAPSPKGHNVIHKSSSAPSPQSHSAGTPSPQSRAQLRQSPGMDMKTFIAFPATNFYIQCFDQFSSTCTVLTKPSHLIEVPQRPLRVPAQLPFRQVEFKGNAIDIISPIIIAIVVVFSSAPGGSLAKSMPSVQKASAQTLRSSRKFKDGDNEEEFDEEDDDDEDDEDDVSFSGDEDDDEVEDEASLSDRDIDDDDQPSSGVPHQRLLSKKHRGRGPPSTQVNDELDDSPYSSLSSAANAMGRGVISKPISSNQKATSRKAPQRRGSSTPAGMCTLLLDSC